MNNLKNKVDLAIIGGGPAGFTAAIYGCRAGLSVAVFSPQVPGSQLVKTNDIENFPGFPEGISGYELLDKMQQQAEKFGAAIYDESVISLKLLPDNSGQFTLKTETGREFAARSVIAAMGAAHRSLGLPSEKKFFGKGVSACAVCDGFFFRNKDVAVIGGGDTALGDAIYLSQFASKVYLIHRREEFRAADSSVIKVKRNEKIRLILDSVVQEIKGDKSVEAITVRNVKTGEISDIPVSGVFVAIGQQPASELLSGLAKLSSSGTIEADERCRTGVPGLFAAGDVADPLYRQAVIAAASGAKAALEAYKFIKER